jgi:glycosyltransferase involved in cell wall biosynthesis
MSSTTTLTGDRVAVVVPCFNERDRLDLNAFVQLAETVTIRFVDDGSSDGTADLLTSFARDHDAIEVQRLPRNLGKAEAVRAGLNAALSEGAQIVAYYDADLAAPPAELLRCIDHLQRDAAVDVVIASRVALLGRRIERRRARHYQGRVFASLASIALRMPIYDTQCGLKVFRATPALTESLCAPFRSKWVFDVELLNRLVCASEPTPIERIVEVPLMAWHDVGDSRLTTRAKLGALVDLARVASARRHLSGGGRSGP